MLFLTSTHNNMFKSLREVDELANARKASRSAGTLKNNSQQDVYSTLGKMCSRNSQEPFTRNLSRTVFLN
jgi:hypothetical protein